MKLHRLRISQFQCFGGDPTEIALDDVTFLIGPNGAGKTAALQALCRLFAFDPTLRRIHRSDFHVPLDETPDTAPDERTFWIEAEFTFPELADTEGEHATVPPHFAHMRLDDPQGIARVRFRLEAKLGADGDIEETLNYVLGVDADDEPLAMHLVPRPDRNNIHVHYLPARRDPSEHIAYTTTSLLGRALRSVNWQAEQETIAGLTNSISEALANNDAVGSLGTHLTKCWKTLHKGSFFADPEVTFTRGEIESLLRHLSVSFSPSHDIENVDSSRLSDGLKSILYLSLVLAMQRIGRALLSGKDKSFDIDKLRPAVFTLVAMEEPENSLSPHYLGRIVQCLTDLGTQNDAQAIIATHSPSILRRVPPEAIRYMRLNSDRQAQVSTIVMPPKKDEAHKFVREAVQAFPELYFSRLVVLAEGDSEEVVLPRLFKAKGLPPDDMSVSVVPLGGRHVNHFWRLLSALEIPFVTLLDLDLGRYQGGWGRIKYVLDQITDKAPAAMRTKVADLDAPPKWNDDKKPLKTNWKDYKTALGAAGVFFSFPLDLDFAMLGRFPDAYGATSAAAPPDDEDIKAVLGKEYHGVNQYSPDQQKLFVDYHKLFKLGSKPATHIGALAKLDDAELLAKTPPCLASLVDAIIAKIKRLPE
jgi:predicted ATP-dependent endonuclease of OLD family